MSSSSDKLLLCATVVVALSSALVSRADSFSLTPSEDATISEGSMDSPLGNETALDVGTSGPGMGVVRSRALLKFDLASNIPANAQVTSASLTMQVIKSPIVTNVWFSLHRVLRNWDQVAVTWTNRLSPPAPWSAPGGAPSGDFAPVVTQSNLIPGLGAFTWVSNPAMVADVQDWVSQLGSNAGWILICELEELERGMKRFGSSEAISVDTRPRLDVQYVVPAPLTLGLLPGTNGLFQFHFNADSNRTYTVFRQTDFGTANGDILTNIPPLPVSTNVTISDLMQPGANYFYRVRTP